MNVLNKYTKGTNAFTSKETLHVLKFLLLSHWGWCLAGNSMCPGTWKHPVCQTTIIAHCFVNIYRNTQYTYMVVPGVFTPINGLPSCSSKVEYRTDCWETWDHKEWLGRIFPRNSAVGEMIVWNLSRGLDYQIILPCKGTSYWEGHGYWNWCKQSLSLQAPMLPLHFLVLLCLWSRISTLDGESGSPFALMCSTGPLYLWQNNGLPYLLGCQPFHLETPSRSFLLENQHKCTFSLELYIHSVLSLLLCLHLVPSESNVCLHTHLFYCWHDLGEWA